MSEIRAFVDTNVLVYAVDEAEPVKQAIARDLLGSDDLDLVISAQVLGEFFVTVTRKLQVPMPASAAQRAVERLAELPTVVIDGPLVAEAIAIHTRVQISYWDGLILAAAGAGGCSRLLTEDLSDGQAIGDVQIVNPFETPGTSAPR